ncbi:MAG TPA: hypothetical protein VK477_05785 [Acidobacteriota bacterium]|nr:hypothetical protein [Acidobacteriota bacterium]
MKSATLSALLRRGVIVALLGRLLVITCLAAAPQAVAADSVRQTMPLNDDWRFHLGEAPEAVFSSFDDSAWRRVDVPHDYVIEEAFTEKNPAPRVETKPDWYWLHAFLPVRQAVYRKTFTVRADAAGKRLWLEFDGVFNNSRYWLNGKEIGQQYSGYTRSRFDITGAAICGGRNVLVVQVDPRYEGWWYEGGGIYRHVRLVTVYPVHVAPDGVFVVPTVSDPRDGKNADAGVVLVDVHALEFHGLAVEEEAARSIEADVAHAEIRRDLIDGFSADGDGGAEPIEVRRVRRP